MNANIVTVFDFYKYFTISNLKVVYFHKITQNAAKLIKNSYPYNHIYSLTKVTTAWYTKLEKTCMYK